MIYIAIIDDDINFLNLIYRKIITLDNETKIDKFSDSRQFLKQTSIQKYDLLFLDIDMPYISGLDISNYLSENFDNSYIIFITNRNDLVLKAFNKNVIGFIPKSNLENDWIQIENKITSLFNRTTTNLKTSEGMVTFQKNSILYFEVIMRKIYLYTDENKKYQLYYPTILRIMEEINISSLFQISRSIVINMNHIIKYNDPLIKLKNSNVDFYLSKNRKDQFIMKYLKNRVV